MDGILNCDSVKEKGKGSSHPRCSMLAHVDEFSTVRSALPALFGGSVCRKVVAHENQESLRGENYTALRELLGDSGGRNDESEAVLSGRFAVLPLLTLVESVRCVRRCMTLLRLRTRWGIRTYLWGSRHNLANPLTGKPKGSRSLGVYII